MKIVQTLMLIILITLLSELESRKFKIVAKNKTGLRTKASDRDFILEDVNYNRFQMLRILNSRIEAAYITGKSGRHSKVFVKIITYDNSYIFATFDFTLAGTFETSKVDFANLSGEPDIQANVIKPIKFYQAINHFKIIYSDGTDYNEITNDCYKKSDKLFELIVGYNPDSYKKYRVPELIKQNKIPAV